MQDIVNHCCNTKLSPKDEINIIRKQMGMSVCLDIRMHTFFNVPKLLL